MSILKKAKVLIDSFDFSGDLNALALDYDAEDQDDTRFGGDTRKLAPGTLKTFAWNLEGFWKAGANEPDPSLFSRIGSTDHIVTVIPVLSTAVEGDIGYIYKGLARGYKFGGKVGDNLPFNVNGGTRGRFVRGKVLHGGVVTATGTGAKFTLGGGGTGKLIYAALHVVSAVGSTNDLTVKVQSDNSTSFGSPNNRINFAQVSGIASQFETDPGTSTDDVYRVSHTVAGATASFEYFVTVGVLSTT